MVLSLAEPKGRIESTTSIGPRGYQMNALHDLGLLTLADVAELLHCSKTHVCKAVSGRVWGCPPIPAVSLGRRKLVRRETPLSWSEKKRMQAAGVLRRAACCPRFISAARP